MSLTVSVAINIVTYNNELTIKTCLESIHQQNFLNYEVCIIDNASIDKTVQFVEEMGYPIHVNTSNMGYGYAHNQALQMTKSKYVLTLNPDIWLDPNFLNYLNTHMENNARLGAVAACMLRVNKLGDTPQVIDGKGLRIQKNRRQRLRHENRQIDNHIEEPTTIFGPDGAAAFYRRDMLYDIAIDGEIFDTMFFLQKEDVDICWRAQLLGWSAEYVPQAIAHHVRSFRPGKRRNMETWIRFYAVRNRYLLILKNDITSHFLRDSWKIIPYDISIIIYMLFFERSSLRAFIDILKNLSKILAKRRVIQSTRKLNTHDMRKRFTGDYSVP